MERADSATKGLILRIHAMRGRLALLSLMILAVIVSCLTVIKHVPRPDVAEPSFASVPLHTWLERLDPHVYHPEERLVAQQAIREIGTNAFPFILSELTAESRTTKFPVIRRFSYATAAHRSGRARRALSIIGLAATSTIPELAEMMKSRNLSTVRNAALVLSGFGASGVSPMLTGLTNEDARAREFIARALYGMGTNASIASPYLLQALDDVNGEVALWAGFALARVTTEPISTERVLVQKLTAERTSCRYGAAMALGELGVTAAGAIPALEELSKDPSVDVRDAAALAIGKIMVTTNATIRKP